MNPSQPTDNTTSSDEPETITTISVTPGTPVVPGNLELTDEQKTLQQLGDLESESNIVEPSPIVATATPLTAPVVSVESSAPLSPLSTATPSESAPTGNLGATSSPLPAETPVTSLTNTPAPSPQLQGTPTAAPVVAVPSVTSEAKPHKSSNKLFIVLVAVTIVVAGGVGFLLWKTLAE